MKQDLPFPLSYDYPDGAALARAFPYMFNKRNIGFDFYRGWQPILAGVSVAVDTLLTNELGQGHEAFAWVQLKEKYGTARLYFDLYRPEREPSRIILLDGNQNARRPRVNWKSLSASVDRLVDAAEVATETACMACGGDAKPDNGTGWITTLCAEHRAWVSDDSDLARIRAFWSWVRLPGVGNLAGRSP